MKSCWGGALRLSSAIALVVFGSMFARVIQKTGISSAIIKKAAELAGDRPIAIGFLMLAATAFVFMGMSGLGAVLMVGSIALPIMTSSGISPLDAIRDKILYLTPSARTPNTSMNCSSFAAMVISYQAMS